MPTLGGYAERGPAVMSGVQAAVVVPRARMTLIGELPQHAGTRCERHGDHGGTADHAPRPRADAAQLEWAINAYLIVSAACIIPGGKACDRFGARRVAMAGLALFAVASVVVATAQVPAVLLAGRALQGLAAALAVPGTLAAISEASARNAAHRRSAPGPAS